MKNLKMFAISLVAFAAMTMGVHATIAPAGSYTNADPDCDKAGHSACKAQIGDKKYSNFRLAVNDALNGDTIELLDDAAPNGLVVADKAITIKLGTHSITMNSTYTITVKDKGSLTLAGPGEIVSSVTGADAIIVEKGGTLETSDRVIVTASGLTAGNALFNVAGTLKVNANAELNASLGNVVEVTDKTATVSLNAKVGTSTSRSGATLISASYANLGTFDTKGATVTIGGGEYYTTTTLVDLATNKGLNVTINGGTFDVKGGVAVNTISVRAGKLEVNGGTFTSEGRTISIYGGDTDINGGTLTTTGTGKGAVVVDGAATEGTLDIKNAKLVSKDDYALSFNNGNVKPKITSGTFESKKNTPAIFIHDESLTGMEDGGDADNFKGMLTGGKYLYMIIGGTVEGTKVKEHSAEDVAKYIIAAGLEEKTEGDYKILGNGATDPEQPGATEPGEQTPGTTPDVPNVPKTSDAILVYAGLGLVSALSVKFTSRKKED